MIQITADGRQQTPAITPLVHKAQALGTIQQAGQRLNIELLGTEQVPVPVFHFAQH